MAATAVAVVGGGLAGLTAATVAAREGASVTLFEARADLGGRARSDEVDGFTFNQGAHALYRGGAGIAVLRELGVTPVGHTPSQRRARWMRDGALVPLLRPSAIGGRRGLRAAVRLVSSRAPRDAAGMSVATWLDHAVAPAARPLAEMLVRTSCYAADFDALDAVEALAQVRRGARNVLYLDGGWSTLVDGLRRAAGAAGVTCTTERVVGVHPGDGRVTVDHGTGAPRTFDAVVLAAGGATQADHLLGGASPTVARWAQQARPVRAACLDVGLRPRAGRGPVAAYGLGEPTYIVDHGRSARLGPDGASLVHCLWYEPDLTPELDHRAELERRLDQLHPGWRDRVVDARFSRRLVVAHDRPQPGATGPDRPRVTVDDVPGVFVAGDWITIGGLLADAAIGSGRAAAHAAVRVARPAGSAVPAR